MKTFILSACLIALSACTSTEFQPAEGENQQRALGLPVAIICLGSSCDVVMSDKFSKAGGGLSEAATEQQNNKSVELNKIDDGELP